MEVSVAKSGKKLSMQRMYATQPMCKAQYVDVLNSNAAPGMVHPFHVHGTQFCICSRNGHAPYPNEHGFKELVCVNPGVTVRCLVRLYCPGVTMYHCHIM